MADLGLTKLLRGLSQKAAGFGQKGLNANPVVPKRVLRHVRDLAPWGTLFPFLDQLQCLPQALAGFFLVPQSMMSHRLQQQTLDLPGTLQRGCPRHFKAADYIGVFASSIEGQARGIRMPAVCQAWLQARDSAAGVAVRSSHAAASTSQ